MQFIDIDDATRRRQADRERAFLMLLFDRMNVAVFATDAGLRITAWNSAAEKLYGWPAEQVIGRPVREVIGAVNIEDEREEILTRLERGEPVRHPILQHHHDG